MLYIMIKKAVEQAIGLPMNASTERLLSTELDIKVEELIEGHLSIQKLRISKTAAGRRIFHKIGWVSQNVTPLVVLLGFCRQEINIPSLLKSMNPSDDEGPRQARAQALNTTLSGDHAVIYTDSSQHRGQQYAIILATPEPTSLLVPHSRPKP